MPSSRLSTAGCAPPSLACAHGHTPNGSPPNQSVTAIGTTPRASRSSCSVNPALTTRFGGPGILVSPKTCLTVTEPSLATAPGFFGATAGGDQGRARGQCEKAAAGPRRPSHHGPSLIANYLKAPERIARLGRRCDVLAGPVDRFDDLAAGRRPWPRATSTRSSPKASRTSPPRAAIVATRERGVERGCGDGALSPHHRFRDVGRPDDDGVRQCGLAADVVADGGANAPADVDDDSRRDVPVFGQRCGSVAPPRISSTTAAGRARRRPTRRWPRRRVARRGCCPRRAGVPRRGGWRGCGPTDRRRHVCVVGSYRPRRSPRRPLSDGLGGGRSIDDGVSSQRMPPFHGPRSLDRPRGGQHGATST